MGRKACSIVQIVLAVIACLFVGQALWTVVSNTGWQWDYQVYYYATRTASAGANPYDTAVVSATTGQHVMYPFLYPPASFTLLGPLAKPEYTLSYYLYFALKLVALGGLIFLWIRLFPKEAESRLIFFITLCFGYYHTVLWDLQTGNVSIFEQFFLWLGIYLLTQRKSIVGSCAIALASVFKSFTLAFLPLGLLLQRSRSQLIAGLIAGFLFVGLNLLWWAFNPTLFEYFLEYVHIPDQRGLNNPSILSVLRDVVEWWDGPVWNVYALYSVAGIVVLSCAAFVPRTLRTHSRIKEDGGGRSSNNEETQRAIIVLAVVAYALLVPRMMNYSWIIMLMPSLYIIRTTLHKTWHRWILYALLWIPFGSYHPYGLALLLFFLFTVSVLRKQNLVVKTEGEAGHSPSLKGCPRTADSV